MEQPKRTKKYWPLAVFVTAAFLVIVSFNLLALHPLTAGAASKVGHKTSANPEYIALDELVKGLQAATTEQEINELLFSPELINDDGSLLIEIFKQVDQWKLKRAVLYQLKNKLFFGQHNKTELASFFRELSKSSNLPLAQDALIALVQAGEKEALKALAEHLEQFTLAAYPDGKYVALPWEISRQIYKAYPQSITAKGIRAYEKISGQPFFDIDAKRFARNYGDGQYNPGKEIPGWLDWLQKYPGHLATDSAAYRLGRSYEITGDYIQALNWFFTAINSPNGAIAYDAQGRLLYVIDVKMDVEALKAALASTKLKAELKPVLEYSLAVKLARAGQYQNAVRQFQAFIKQYDNQDIFVLNKVAEPTGLSETQNSWDFWSKVKEQQAKITELSAYAQQIAEIENAQESAPLRYQLASLIYHDTYIFYNHLWQGNRIYYNWLGHINEIREQPKVKAELQNYLKEHNNYYQALEMFQELAATTLSPDLAEKVDFSIALAYAHLEYYGQEINVLWTEEEQLRLVAEAFQNYLNKYPEGNYREKAIQALIAYGLISNP